MSDQPSTTQSGLTPQELGRRLNTGPVCSSHDLRWEAITAQRFQFGSRQVDVPGMKDHVLAIQLGGPVFMEWKDGKSGTRQRWFETGTTNIIPAGQVSERRLQGRSDVLTLSIRKTLVDQTCESAFEQDARAMELQSSLAQADPVLRRLGLIILEEMVKADASSSLMADSLGHAIALRLVRYHSSLFSRSSPEEPVAPLGKMRVVVDYMRAHLGEDLRLAQLAAVGGLSPSHFVRAFRRASGSPPHRYLMKLRIEEACQLLQRSTASVTEISAQCGFQQPGHFATAFRNATGLSPRAWRRVRMS